MRSVSRGPECTALRSQAIPHLQHQVGMTKAMVVSRKERHLLVVIDDGITSLGVGMDDSELGQARSEAKMF